MFGLNLAYFSLTSFSRSASIGQVAFAAFAFWDSHHFGPHFIRSQKFALVFASPAKQHFSNKKFTMNAFSTLSFILLFIVASTTVLAEKSAIVRLKKPDNVDVNNLTPEVVESLNLYVFVAEMELQGVVAETSSTPDIFYGKRQLRGSNDERRLPPADCLNTCPKCMSNNGNDYLYCKVICGLCARRSLQDEALALEETSVNPLKGNECKKVPRSQALTDIEVVVEEGVGSFDESLSPDQAHPTFYICEE